MVYATPSADRNAALVAMRGRSGVTTWHTLRRDRIGKGKHETVRRHDLRGLDGARSLEGLLGRFGGGEIVFDPTGAFERARRLVAAARSARQSGGRRLVSLHLLPCGRTLYARARTPEDIEHIAPVVGAALARALSGCDFQVAVTFGCTRAPAGALPLERIGARQDQMMAMAQRVSMALAVTGAVFYGMQPKSANASEPTQDIAAAASASAAAVAMTPPGLPTRTVHAIYSPAGALLALHLADEDRGGTEESAQAAMAIVREQSLDVLNGATGRRLPVGPGAWLKTRRHRSADGLAYSVEVSATDAPAKVVNVSGEGSSPAVPADPVLPLPGDVAFSEAGASYISRGDQSGGLAVAAVQFAATPDVAIELQGALGSIDGDVAGGAEIGVQHFITYDDDKSVAFGAYVSDVQSTAPSGEDFSIFRGALGAELTTGKYQLVVRGGYASGGGDLDESGGFVRAEGSWFVVPELALNAFAEQDPTTGAGAGVGATFKPFSGVLANMMIDADAAWHEDGEDSFRLGLRWLLGKDSSLRDAKARRGIAGSLVDDLQRLPDELQRSTGTTSKAQPYCGSATTCPPTTTT